MEGTSRKRWDPPDLQIVFATAEGSDVEDDRSSVQSDSDEQSGWVQHQPPQMLQDGGSLLQPDVTNLPTWAQLRSQPPELAPAVTAPTLVKTTGPPMNSWSQSGQHH